MLVKCNMGLTLITICEVLVAFSPLCLLLWALYGIFSFFFCSVIKYSDKGNLRKKGRIYFSYQMEVWSIMLGRSRLQKLEVAGYIESTVRKEREGWVNSSYYTAPFSILQSRIPAREQCHAQCREESPHFNLGSQDNPQYVRWETHLPSNSRFCQVFS